MAYGGGNFTSMNKRTPGSYMNVVSTATVSSALSDRGIAACPFALDWGESDKVITVTNADFQKDSLKLFGYNYSSPELYALREIFKKSRLIYVYNLNSGGTVAQSDYGTAKFKGIRGNDLKIVIQTNIDDTSKFDVITFLGTTEVDSQTVAQASELIDNDFIIFDKQATLTLTAGTALSGGANGTSDVSGHQAFLNKVEGLSFNMLCCPSDESEVKSLYAAYTERLRKETQAKFQTAIYNYPGDFEGLINVKNDVVISSDNNHKVYDLVYWVSGFEASLKFSESGANRIYDGELTINTDYTPTEVTTALDNGEFIFHEDDGKILVLEDVNSLKTFTAEKGPILQDNQTIRIVDQLGIDFALLFKNKYMGKIPNDQSGRISLWADIKAILKVMSDARAIEPIDESTLTVELGEDKHDVVVFFEININGTMLRMYLTCLVR